MKILGISRSEVFSPHLEENDAAIFRAVTERLRAWGHEVMVITEAEMLKCNVTLEFSMTGVAQSCATKCGLLHW